MPTDSLFRHLRTRNILYSDREMKLMRLKAVYNSTGDEEMLDLDYLQLFFEECVRDNDWGLMEIQEGPGGTLVASVLVFADIWSRNLYAMRHWEVYDDTGQVTVLLN